MKLVSPISCLSLIQSIKVDSPKRSLIFADQIKAQSSKRILGNTVILKSQKFKMKVFCLSFNLAQTVKIFPSLTLDQIPLLANLIAKRRPWFVRGYILEILLEIMQFYALSM